MDNGTTPDDQYREDAVKALHLHLHHQSDHSADPVDDERLRSKAEVWVDSAVKVATAELVMLFAGSAVSAEMLARAVVQCAGPDTEPTPQDIAEARAVIGRMAGPPAWSS
jgi:hypothetical protein